MDKRRLARIAAFLPLALVIALMTSLPARGAYAQTVRGPKSAGALAVKGSKLVDKNGKAIQLKGVSTHGLAWFPSYVNDACFKQLRTKWGANVVRLAMYTQEYGGYCSGGNKKDLLALVKKGVKLAAQNDLYAIVDWHILSDGNPNTHVSEAKSFFSNVSKTFAKNTNVIYEICNEPNGSTTWSDIKKYAKKVIPVIRKNDPDAVIIVGTPTWSQEVDKAAQSPLSYKNVLYALHFYAATHKDDLRARMTNAVKGGLPVFVSEFGICDASGNGSIDKSSANAWVKSMDKLGVSWCMWSLCNKDESASILKSGCSKSSGFKTSDLSTSGKWLLNTLGGTASGSTATADGAGGTGGKAADKGSASSGNSSSTTTKASGKSVTFTSGKLSCKATLTSSWPAGNGKTCYQYDLTITNKGAARTSWSVSVPFNKKIAFTNGWNGTYKASGSTLTIKSMDYNGTIAKGGKVEGVGFQVTAASGLGVKK
ncbi:MAG: cellulase family glycosylhydrolase [Atopobiaceae bacterium]|nr:cellulase family glycosylhydrolase [Atopobiaceae bacterium]